MDAAFLPPRKSLCCIPVMGMRGQASLRARWIMGKTREARKKEHHFLDGAKQEGKLFPCAQAPQEILAEVHSPLPGDPRLPEIPPQKYFQQPAQEQ